MARQKYSILGWPNWLLHTKRKRPPPKTLRSISREARNSCPRNNRRSRISPVSPQQEPPSEHSPTCPPSRSEKRNWTAARTCFLWDWFSTRWLRDIEPFRENLLRLFMMQFSTRRPLQHGF